MGLCCAEDVAMVLFMAYTVRARNQSINCWLKKERRKKRIEKKKRRPYSIRLPKLNKNEGGGGCWFQGSSPVSRVYYIRCLFRGLLPESESRHPVCGVRKGVEVEAEYGTWNSHNRGHPVRVFWVMCVWNGMAWRACAARCIGIPVSD